MTIKEKCISIKNKVVDIWKKHKAEIIIAGVAIGGVTIACIAAAKTAGEYQEDLDYDYSEAYRNPDPPESTCEIDSVFTDDFCTRNWDEELYRENWDRVNEFAKTLKLHKGESYILDDSQQFYDQSWYDDEKDGHVIVSHMLNGDGCYPPENKEEEAA